MTENALTALETAPAPDVIRAHLNLIVTDAYEALKATYEAIQAGQDPEDALVALDSHVAALHEFGDQSIAIQAGLIEYGAVVTGQRDDLIRRDETIRAALDEEIPGLLEVAADPAGAAYTVGDILQDYAYDVVDTESIIAEHEDAINTEVENLMITLRDEGLHADADALESQFCVVAQARDGLTDLISVYTRKLNERAEEELASVEPMVFDDDESELD
jgi:hypothetical protein